MSIKKNRHIKHIIQAGIETIILCALVCILNHVLNGFDKACITLLAPIKANANGIMIYKILVLEAMKVLQALNIMKIIAVITIAYKRDKKVRIIYRRLL